MTEQRIQEDEARAYRVIRYDPSAALAELRKRGVASSGHFVSAFPAGFPLVVHADDHAPVMPVCLALLERHQMPRASGRAPRSLNTAVAAAYDFAQFLEHLDFRGIDYAAGIGQEDVNEFARSQSLGPSAATGVRLAERTIRRRLASVAAICATRPFAAACDAAAIDFSMVPIAGRRGETTIHPLLPEEWRRLAGALGPLPSAAPAGVSTVRRLVAQWALRTGMRRAELAALPLSSVSGPVDSHAPDGAVVIIATTTKGGRPRKVWVPNDLRAETIRYVEGERRECLGGRSDHGLLFVKPSSAHTRSGEPVTGACLGRWVRNACRSAGLVRRSTDPDTPRTTMFSIHDLRHTYAVWSYLALSRAGIRPEKILQARLGHRSLQTTIDVYLAFIDENEERISDVLADFTNDWTNV